MTNGNGIHEDARKRSVTADELRVYDTNGDASSSYVAPVTFYLAAPFETGADIDMLPMQPPPYWSRTRDILLRQTPLRQAMWGDIVYKAATRVAAYGWVITDGAKSQRRVSKTQNLLHDADFGAGWVKLVEKLVKDFSCTDNGAFLEVIRQSNARGSKVLGIRHLDSLRCWRTGDPSYPVAYQDLLGRFHLLKDYQVIDFVDMPSSDVRLRGVGQCAASRAYTGIATLQYLDRYTMEKLSGRHQQVVFVNGVNREQLRGALTQAEADAVNEGFVRYFGTAFLTTMRPEAPQTAVVPLSGLPDNVNIPDVQRACYLLMCHSIGMFIGEIQPLEGQYGTGTQSVLLSDAAQGQGLASFLAQWEHRFSRDVAPSTTTFAFDNKNDVREQQSRANVAARRVETRKLQVEFGELTTDQARQMAADVGDIDRSFLGDLQAVDDSLSDDEKPTPTDSLQDEGEDLRQEVSLKSRADAHIEIEREAALRLAAWARRAG